MTPWGILGWVAVALAPGMVWAAASRDNSRSVFLVAGGVTSLAAFYLIVQVGALVGQMPAALIAAGLGAIIVLGFALRLSHLRRPRVDLQRSVGLLLVSAVPVTLLLTPGWNFFMAHNMDAGNYEVVSNHYATTGSYWYEPADDLEVAGGETEWVFQPANTWWSDASGVGRQFYFPAYPVLLGSFKAMTGSYTGSWVLNLVFATMTLLLLFRIAESLQLGTWAAAGATVIVGSNLAFLYYSKQLMSEQLAVLGMSALVWAAVDNGTPARPRATVAAAAAILTSASKLDAFLPLFAVLLAMAIAARADPPLRRITTGALAGTALGAAIVSALAVPSYLRKLAPPLIPTFGGVLEGASFLALAVVALVATSIALWSWAPRASLSRWNPGNRTALVVGAAWFVTGVWMIAFRPHGVSLVDDHDAHNLVRLLQAWSPMATMAIFVGGAFATKRLPATARLVGLALSATFGLILLRSQHSALDLWWVRRYLPTALPLGVVALSGVWLCLRDKLANAATRRVTTALALSLACATMLGQLVVLSPLYSERQNAGLPSQVLRVAEVSGETPVLVVNANRGYVGFGNALRSVREAPTVPSVPPEGLVQAIARQQGEVLVLAPTGLVARELGGEVEVVAEGRAAGDWADWRRDLGVDREPRWTGDWELVRFPGTDS